MRGIAGLSIALLVVAITVVMAQPLEAGEYETTTTVAETTTTPPPETTTTTEEVTTSAPDTTTTTVTFTTTSSAPTSTTTPTTTTTTESTSTTSTPTSTTIPPVTTTSPPSVPRSAQIWIGCVPADDSVQVVAALNGTFDSVHYLVTDEDGNVLFENTDSGTFSARDNGPFLIVNLPGVEGRKVVTTVTADELTDTFTSAGDCVEVETEDPKALPLTGANSVELGALALLLLTSGGVVTMATHKKN